MPKFASQSQEQSAALIARTQEIATESSDARRYPIRHESGAIDKRWRISREFTGAATAQSVVRFCDEFRGAFATDQEARAAAVQMETNRRRAMGVTS